jgi:fused signal recognition particle receptor
MDTQTQITKFNLPDAAIAKMAEEYLPLTIAGVNDAAGFKAVHEARMIVKSKRVDVEKVRKELKADALEYGRKVDSEANRIKAMLEPIESHLTAQEEAYQAEKDRIKNAARLKAEEEARAKAEAEAARLQAEWAAIEFERKAEAERLRVEREKLAAERAAIEAERKAAQDKIDAERRAIEAEQKRIANIQAQQARGEEIERAKAEAAERARQETEARIAREAAEAKAKAEREEAARARAEALRPDREKLATVAAIVRGIDVPEMSTSWGNVAAFQIRAIIEGTAKKIDAIVSQGPARENW